MSTLVLSYGNDIAPEDINAIQFTSTVGNTVAGWPSHVAKLTITVNGGPSQNSGYYKDVVAICDGSRVPYHSGPLEIAPIGVLEVGSRSHAERIIAGLQKAIELGWLK